MYPLRMARSLAVAAGLAAIAFPSAASAASLTVSPQKRCYSSGEAVSLTGAGFVPSNDTSKHVQLDRGRTSVGRLSTDPFGAFVGTLTLGLDSGRETRTYTATDLLDPSITASTQLTVSAVRVGLEPANGSPGRRLTVKARGFTTGPTLWAHVIRGKSRRNVKVGQLEGACGNLTIRRRLLPRDAAFGVHKLQFDTFQSYDPDRPVADRYTITVSRF